MHGRWYNTPFSAWLGGGGLEKNHVLDIGEKNPLCPLSTMFISRTYWMMGALPGENPTLGVGGVFYLEQT